MKTAFEFAGILHFESDDGGSALIAELPGDLPDDLDEHGPAVFIRLHGWDETGEHPTLRPLEGLWAMVHIEVGRFP
jgi:hypothetical protein